MQIPKPPGIITLLSLTPLNLAISVCKYWITAHHTPLRQAITSPCKQAGNGGTEWLSDYSSITTQVWESQELNLYFLHLSLRLSVLFCVAALILPWRGRLGSLKSLSLLLWLTGDVANGIGIVAFPTSKGGTQCDICLLEEILTIQVLKNINIYLIWYKRNGIWTFVFEQ